MRRRKRIVAAVVIGTILAVGLANAVAYAHARAFTRYAPSSARTPAPEELSFGRKLEVLVTGATIPRPENSRTPRAAGLPFSTHALRTADGVKLEAWRIEAERPGGARVILFPGWSEAKGVLLGEAAALHALGLEVVLIDFRGCGGSDGDTTTLGVREALDVEAAVAGAASAFGPRPTILYGRSMGAVAILRAIDERRVEPDAIVLECPFDSLLETVKNRFASMGLPGFPFAELLVFWGGRQQGFDGFAHEPAAYARAVRCPALVLYGREDGRVTGPQVRRVVDAIPGAKRLIVFEGAGHESYLARSPQEWRLAVREFVAELSPSR